MAALKEHICCKGFIGTGFVCLDIDATAVNYLMHSNFPLSENFANMYLYRCDLITDQYCTAINCIIT